jgi:hypothetical protein
MNSTEWKDAKLEATRNAIDAIKNGSIRDDLLRFVTGAEVCLHHEETYLAFDCVRTIVTTVVALDRTLSSEVAAGVLDGLVKDSQAKAVVLRRALGFNKEFDAKCDIKPGTPIGSSSCVSSTNSVCYTLSSGSGCGGPSGFHFVWEVALDSSGALRS